MNISAKDPNQIIRAEHDEEFNSKRVTIVGGDFGIEEAFKKAFENGLPELKFSGPLKCSGTAPIWPLHVEKEVLVKDYEVISIPKIIYETKIVEVEKQVIVKEIQIVEVPKIVTEYQTIEKSVIVEKTNSKVLILFFIGQLLILALTKLIN